MAEFTPQQVVYSSVLKGQGTSEISPVPGAAGVGWAPPVDDVAALAALDASLFPDGAFIFVRSVRDLFALDRTSALAVEPVTVVNATGGGQWLRLMTPDESWLYQASWFINATLGDDENVGNATGAGALRTHDELERRWGVTPRALQQSTTVNVETDIGASKDVFIGISPASDSFTLRYVGIPTVVASGTLTAATATAPATNTQQSVTNGAAPGWAAHVGRRIALQTAGGIAYSTIGKEVSASEARCADFIIPDASGLNGTYYAPLGNENYTVETLPVLRRGLTTQGPTDGEIVLEGVLIGETNTTLKCERKTTFLASSFLNGCVVNGSAGSITLIACCLGPSSLRNCRLITIGCAAVGGVAPDTMQWTLPALTAGTAHFYQQSGAGSGLAVGAGVSFVGGNVRGIGCFDNVGQGLGMGPGAVVGTLGALYGAGNAQHGLQVPRTATYVYEATANKPTITGAVGDAQCGGTVYPWANVPLNSNFSWGGIILRTAAIGAAIGIRGERIQTASVLLVAGVGTLAAGIYVLGTTKIIPIPRGANGGAAMGVPTETARVNGAPGVGSVTITSFALATGIAVATDVRTVDLVLVD